MLSSFFVHLSRPTLFLLSSFFVHLLVETHNFFAVVLLGPPPPFSQCSQALYLQCTVQSAYIPATQREGRLRAMKRQQKQLSWPLPMLYSTPFTRSYQACLNFKQ
jgi:hypothetical protein